jgi:FkbM family methyltransferase
MIDPKQPGLLVNVGKTGASLLARILMQGSLAKALRLSESYLAFIQGKGAGAGWDIQGEASTAILHVHRPDAILFDVGAHRGKWSQQILEALGPANRCSIYQFEPLPLNQAKLRSLNLPRTILVEAAVSDKSGIGTIYTPDAWSPVASLHSRRDSYLQHYRFIEEKVKVVTIDEVIDDFNIDFVDFMKLDIEGNEVAALQGSRESLRSKRIRALTFEFGSGNINSRTYFHDFWDLLHTCGYVIKRICLGGVLFPIEEYYEDLEYFRGVTNYLAVSP